GPIQPGCCNNIDGLSRASISRTLRVPPACLTRAGAAAILMLPRSFSSSITEREIASFPAAVARFPRLGVGEIAYTHRYTELASQRGCERDVTPTRRACVPSKTGRPALHAGRQGIQKMTSEKMRGHGIKHSI